MPDRKWRMVSLGAGDYLLPSNDRMTLWRIWRYTEDDGTLTQQINGEWVVVRGTFWAVSRYADPITDNTFWEDIDVWDDRWQEAASMFDTRREAIEYALSREVAPSP